MTRYYIVLDVGNPCKDMSQVIGLFTGPSDNIPSIQSCRIILAEPDGERYELTAQQVQTFLHKKKEPKLNELRSCLDASFINERCTTDNDHERLYGRSRSRSRSPAPNAYYSYVN